MEGTKANRIAEYAAGDRSPSDPQPPHTSLWPHLVNQTVAALDLTLALHCVSKPRLHNICPNPVTD